MDIFTFGCPAWICPQPEDSKFDAPTLPGQQEQTPATVKSNRNLVIAAAVAGIGIVVFLKMGKS